MKPKPITILQPAYTDDARGAQIEGKVRIEITVGADGNVTAARVLEGLGHGLDEAALEAARGVDVRAGTRCGKPVATTFVIGDALRAVSRARVAFVVARVAARSRWRWPRRARRRAAQATPRAAPAEADEAAAAGEVRRGRLPARARSAAGQDGGRRPAARPSPPTAPSPTRPSQSRPGAAFDAAAVAAARQFVFEPAEIDGKPAPIRILYQYDVRHEVEAPTPAIFDGVVRDRADASSRSPA